MSGSSKRIFITGGTGDVGSKTIKLFEKSPSDVELRILCRREKQVEDFRTRDLSAVLGDLGQSVKQLSKLMSGCKTLILITAAIQDQEQQLKTAIDAAVVAGVSFIIKLSAADARHEVNVPWAKAHAVTDDYLTDQAKKHGIEFVLLKTSAFMQNLLTEAAPISKGFLPQACGSGKAGWM